jgi:hypothetical protein
MSSPTTPDTTNSSPPVPEDMRGIRHTDTSAELTRLPPDEPYLKAIEKWRSELMNTAKYGKIHAITVGLKYPWEKVITIFISPDNTLAVNIPASLDDLPVQVLSGNLIAAS